MARVLVVKVGSETITVDAETAGEALGEAGYEGNYHLTINGAASSADAPLQDNAVVVLGEKIKGGSAL